MKMLTIRLPDGEAGTLLEAQMRNKDFRDLQAVLIKQIYQEYAKTSVGKTDNR